MALGVKTGGKTSREPLEAFYYVTSEGFPVRRQAAPRIQGSAADIIKMTMINIHKKLTSGNWKSKMLLQVHDELVFDVHHSELEKIKPMIKHEMENAFQLDVPLEVDLGAGRDWLEAH